MRTKTVIAPFVKLRIFKKIQFASMVQQISKVMVVNPCRISDWPISLYARVTLGLKRHALLYIDLLRR